MNSYPPSLMNSYPPSPKNGYVGQAEGQVFLKSQITKYRKDPEITKYKFYLITHYTQGLQVLDISNPESPVEVGYYDDRETMNINIDSTNYFRKNTNNWYQGIYPDTYPL
ncbi:MAG: hypothetical protein GXO85_01770 [Chlorobi bacterium]|nr:hypothetical protein [Chlorobiota bacterium]